MIEAIDTICDRFDVPKMRGWKGTAGGKAAANMGDGVMGFNAATFNHFAKMSQEDWDSYRASKSAENWKAGDPESKRTKNFVWNAKTPADAIRTIIYHELGHHIHQYYKGDYTQIYSRGNGYFEKKIMFEMFEIKGRNIFDEPNLWKITGSPTRYGDTNPFEWFAENFAGYWMGYRDMVDPRFSDMIESALRGTSNV